MANANDPKIISKELHALRDELQSTNAAIADLKSNPTKIDVVHVAPDYFAAGITLFATFLGAYFAYAINTFAESLKDRRSRINEVNNAINTLVLNLNTLLNFKGQFLVKDDDVVDAMKKHAGKYTRQPSNELLEEYKSSFRKQIERIHEENLDAVFQKWDELEFPELFHQKSVLFLIEYRPDDLRIFDVVRDQIKTINRTIKLRNELWKKLEAVGVAGFPPDISGMSIVYEFLGLRYNIKICVNTAIAAIIESLERLAEFQDQKLASPKFLGIRIFGKFRTMKWSVPKEASFLIPNKDQYAAILRRPPPNNN